MQNELYSKNEAIDLVMRTLMAQNDVLSLVVTGHLYIEYWREWLIRVSVPRPQKLLESARLTFSQKLAIAESIVPISGDMAEAIRIVNKMRNNIAHDLEYQPSQEDVQKLARFRPSLNSEEEFRLSILGSPKTELIFFCVYFAGYAAGVVSRYRKGLVEKIISLLQNAEGWELPKNDA
jgi:hypothetical protein